MKCEVRIDGDMLKIRLDSESRADDAKIFEAAQFCNLPVKSFGAMNGVATFAWFNIPLAKRRDTSFGNYKKKR